MEVYEVHVKGPLNPDGFRHTTNDEAHFYIDRFNIECEVL